MEQIPDIKEELFNEFADGGSPDGSSAMNEVYIDTPDFINIKSLTELEVKKSPNGTKNSKSSSKTNKKKSSKDSNSKVESDGDNKRKKQTYKPKPIPCEICGKVLTSSKCLLIHMRIHNDEKPFKCEFCEKSFRQTGGLAAHIRTHFKEKPYPCPDCDGSFTTASSLKRHQKRIHEKGKSFDCTSCPERFYSMVSYRKHRDEKHSRKCSKCGVMVSPALYRRHMRETHVQPRRNVRHGVWDKKICILCGEQMEYRSHAVHKLQHLHYTADEMRTAKIDHIYPCKMCDNQSSSLRSLFLHVASHMEKTHKCEECNKAFSFFLYNNHKKQFHEERVCQLCNKMFSGISAYRSHRYRVHTTHCPICKKFCRKPSLDIHMRIAHAQECEVGPRNHQCVYCHQLFLTKGAIPYHIIRNHRNVLTKSCDICNIKFEHLHELTKHMQIKHANPFIGKPMTCHICKKLFRNRETLKTHIYRHKNCDGTCFNIYLDQNNFTYLKSKRACVHKVPNTQDKGKKHKLTCRECSQGVKNAYALKRHSVIHSINYKSCRFCNIDYDIVEKLKRHFRKCHRNEKIFRCDHCNVELGTYRKMMNHRKSQHHKKIFWSTYRTNIQGISNKNTEDIQESESVENEVEVPNIKNEPVEEDFNSDSYLNDFYVKTET